MYGSEPALKRQNSNEDADRRGVTRGAGVVGERIDHLEKSVRELQEAISSILAPEPPEVAHKAGPTLAAPFGSHLAITLDNYGQRINSLSDQVQSLLRRIEL
jgi:hypothetical protein